jgi:UDP-glucuronate 4-epimerase
VINLGSGRPIGLIEMIREIESALGVPAILENCPDQPGDVPQTYASIEKARDLLGYQPSVEFHDGIRQFVEWFSRQPAHSRT